MRQPARTNFKSLLYFLSRVITEKLAEYRKGTPYESMRESDIIVFVSFSRGPSTIADTARRLSISRQAVHMSLQRLIKLGLVSTRAIEGNLRDKEVFLTAKGKTAISVGAKHTERLEKEMVDIIGTQTTEKLRAALIQLTEELPTLRD